MTINVLVNGAFGRMGQCTVKALSEDGRFNLVGQTGREYDLKKAIKDSDAHVVIDFTDADSVFKNSEAIIEAGARPVIGTSGLTQDQITKLEQMVLKKNLGGIIAPNFSLGAVLMMKHAADIARYMPNVEIVEWHHDKKIDSPSGTALRTAEMLAGAHSQLNAAHMPTKETIPHARGATHHGVPIHAIRLPGLLAHQTIIFGGTGESLTLRHDSLDRSCFMPGVLLACEKVMGLKKLIYGLEQVL